MAGFAPWDVSKLSHAAMDVESVLESVPRESLAIEEVPHGRFRVKYPFKMMNIEFEADCSVGYNVSSVEIFNNDRPRAPAQTYKINYRQLDEGWVVDSLDMYLNGESVTTSWSLSYSDIEPNAVIPPDVFTLAGAQVKENSRILDQRKEAIERKYRYVQPTKTDEKALDNLLEQLDDLPRHDGVRFERITRRPSWHAIAIFNVIGCLCLVVIGAIVCRRERKRRARQ